MTENRTNRFTPEEKTKWWGEGEWVNEPDLVTFEHMGIECMVMRVAMEEPHAKDFHMFGGFLNGYVAVPANHPYYQKNYSEIDRHIDCHGGLTFGECSDRHWIGFDCAHSGDYTPSTEYLKKMEDLKKKLNMQDSPIFKNSYKNIEYCINECKSMAKQLIEIAKMGSSEKGYEND